MRLRSGASTVSSKTAFEFTAKEEVDKPIISRLRLRETELPQIVPISKRCCVGLIDKTLDPVKGFFKCRLDTLVTHWPVDSDTTNPARCQLHT